MQTKTEDEMRTALRQAGAITQWMASIRYGRGSSLPTSSMTRCFSWGLMIVLEGSG